jgi:hypothetical protein
MALTRKYEQTIKARLERDREFRAALLAEAVQQIIAGNETVGKAILRDHFGAKD